jgi:membrane protein implicated in regulation of membrane protease activity
MSYSQSFKGRGIVEMPIDRIFPGRIYFQASHWPAKLPEADEISAQLFPGDVVEVIGRDGITLIVRPFLCK